MAHAQLTTGTTVTTVMKSGLHSFLNDHTAVITVAEIGSARPSSSVRIEFRDQTDALVAAIDGVLRRGAPVRLRMPIKVDEGVAQIRTVVRIVSLVDEGSVPATVFEDHGPDSFIGRVIVCVPPGGRGGGQTYCPGWYLTTTENPGAQ
jgi:hypothetical protein